MQKIAIRFKPRDRELFLDAWKRGHDAAVAAVDTVLDCKSSVKFLESPLESFIVIEFHRVVLGFDWQRWLRDIQWMGLLSAPVLWDQPMPVEAVEVVLTE